MSDDVATKKGIEDLTDLIRESMHLSATNFENLESKFGDLKIRFNGLEDKFDGLQVTVSRIENKLDATIDKVDDHEVRISALEQHAA